MKYAAYPWHERWWRRLACTVGRHDWSAPSWRGTDEATKFVHCWSCGRQTSGQEGDHGQEIK